MKDDRNPLVRADPRWYETLGGPAPWTDEHWRDPFVMADPDGKGWHLLVTARANTGPAEDRGVIGHARSADLLNRDVQPPPSHPGAGFGQLEVFQVAEVDGRHVLIFNCLPGEYSATRRASGARGAIWAAIAESPLGPFDIAGATPLTDDPSMSASSFRTRPARGSCWRSRTSAPTVLSSACSPTRCRCAGTATPGGRHRHEHTGGFEDTGSCWVRIARPDRFTAAQVVRRRRPVDS